MLSAITAAQRDGARLAPACRIVGISARTVERWRGKPGSEDARCGPIRRPRNALSPGELAQILSVLTSSRYTHLSPKHLVPQLATKGYTSPPNRPYTACSGATASEKSLEA
jgi:putative transposase